MCIQVSLRMFVSARVCAYVCVSVSEWVCVCAHMCAYVCICVCERVCHWMNTRIFIPLWNASIQPSWTRKYMCLCVRTWHCAYVNIYAALIFFGYLNFRATWRRFAVCGMIATETKLLLDRSITRVECGMSARESMLFSEWGDILCISMFLQSIFTHSIMCITYVHAIYMRTRMLLFVNALFIKYVLSLFCYVWLDVYGI